MTSIVRRCAPVVVGLLLLGCGPVHSVESSEPLGVNQKTIKQVLREHTDQLMAVPGVVGVAGGLCNDTPCILVMVEKDTAELHRQIPSKIDGYLVRVEITGKIHSLPNSPGD